eukprot:g1816.t1
MSSFGTHDGRDLNEWAHSEDDNISGGEDIDGSVESFDYSADELAYWGQPSLAPVEAVHVTTIMIRAPHEVRALQSALYNGIPAQDMLPLPMSAVNKILQKSQFHCIIEKKTEQGFQGGNMCHCLFKFGPLPAKPFKVEIVVVSHDQGWSSYPNDQGTYRNSWTWGEVDVINEAERSKLPERIPVFTNLHARSNWQTHDLTFENDERFMSCLETGDILEMYFRSAHPGWVIYVREAKMTVHYTPPTE